MLELLTTVYTLATVLYVLVKSNREMFSFTLTNYSNLFLQFFYGTIEKCFPLKLVHLIDPFLKMKSAKFIFTLFKLHSESI